MSVYFNPNWNPSYFYRLIKPLALVYDQIVIWSPVQSHLEDAGFTTDDFLKATQPEGRQTPIIIPAGRDTWFNSDFRRSHPDLASRTFDMPFESKVHEMAKRNKSVLSNDDLSVGYQALDEIWADQDHGRPHIERIAEESRKAFPDSMVVRIEEVAEKLHKPLNWATANVFFQDVRAIRQLRVGAPLVPVEYAKGYLCLSLNEHSESLSAENVEVIRERLLKRQEFPELPDNVPAEELLQFLDDLADATRLTWDEVLELRRSKKHKIRAWLNISLERNRRPLNSTVSEIATMRASSLYKKARTQSTHGMALILGGITLAGAHSPQALAAVILPLLGMTRFQTPIVRSVAKWLGHKTDRFLVDTPFFADAELRES